MCRSAKENHVSNPHSHRCGGGQVTKNVFTRNCMKCAHLQRKMFITLNPIVKYHFFARNCMKTAHVFGT